MYHATKFITSRTSFGGRSAYTSHQIFTSSLVFSSLDRVAVVVGLYESSSFGSGGLK